MRKKIFILALATTLGGVSLSVQTAKVHAIELTDILGNTRSETGNIITELENIIKNIEPSEAQKLFDFIEEQIEAGNWETKEGIDKAIEEGENLFNIQLTESQRQKLEQTIDKIKFLNISPEFILEQAKKVYEKYGGKLEEDSSKEKRTEDEKESLEEGTFKDGIRKEVSNSIKDYFTTVVNNVKNFIKGFLNIQDI